MRKLKIVAAGMIGLLATTSLAIPANAAAEKDEQYLPADKSGFGTSRTTASKVWFTVQKEGGLGEVFHPRIDSPSSRAMEFVVADRHGHAVRANQAAIVRTEQTDERSLSFRQTFTERSGRWRLTADYVTDPARPTVLTSLTFHAARPHDLYVVYDPALANTRGNDSGRTVGGSLIATDGDAASTLAGSPAFGATSSGLRGVDDGWTDLLADGRLDHRGKSAGPGNLVQTALTGLTGRPGARHGTLALAFGDSAGASAAARASLRQGFAKTSFAYARGWHTYVDGLDRTPSSLTGTAQRKLYRTSAMVLAAAEDKTHRGAYVAAPAAPWAFGTDDPSGPYHLVWSRDLYQIATGLIAAGDRAGANRALDFLFGVQQKPDGSFPQNSRVDGSPVWGGLQLDEVALPIVLAHQLRRSDTWPNVKRAADFLIGYENAPFSPQERWENQSGYSPNTIATAIAALVCAADMAPHKKDAAAYLAVADEWQKKLKGWTVTTNGPYSKKPYFLRLTKDGNPNAGTTYVGSPGTELEFAL